MYIGTNSEYSNTSETDSERRDELSKSSVKEDEDKPAIQPRDSKRRVAAVKGGVGSGVGGRGAGKGSGSTMSSGTFCEKIDCFFYLLKKVLLLHTITCLIADTNTKQHYRKDYIKDLAGGSGFKMILNMNVASLQV